MRLESFASPWFWLAVAGVVASLGVVVSLITTRMQKERERRRLRDYVPPRRYCPQCGSGSLSMHPSSLWDGYTAEGDRCGGSAQYATCDDCGARLLWSSSTTYSPKAGSSLELIAVDQTEGVREVTLDEWRTHVGEG